jgi:hypothetical protein
MFQHTVVKFRITKHKRKNGWVIQRRIDMNKILNFFFFNLENVSKILISVQATHSQEHVFFFFVVVRVVGQQGIS